MKSILLFVAAAALATGLPAWAQAPVAVPAASGPSKVIFDTDFNIGPSGDGLALAMAVKSPALQVLGVTTVAGNSQVLQETASALRELEVLGRPDIPVFTGAGRPLVHEVSQVTPRGKWWSDDPVVAPPGGFAKTKAQEGNAVDFLIRAVDANPGQVTIIAVGPLTNIAMAIRLSPGFASKVKQINVMGGAVGFGAGNVTPNSEFNFWVDPEAALVVMRSGIPISLTDLNVARKTAFTKAAYDKIMAVDTPVTRFFKEPMSRAYAQTPGGNARNFTDELSVLVAIDPTLVKVRDMYVDVDINHGPNYGAAMASARPWEGAERARQISVQTDVDHERLMALFVDLMTRE